MHIYQTTYVTTGYSCDIGPAKGTYGMDGGVVSDTHRSCECRTFFSNLKRAELGGADKIPMLFLRAGLFSNVATEPFIQFTLYVKKKSEVLGLKKGKISGRQSSYNFPNNSTTRHHK